MRLHLFCLLIPGLLLLAFGRSSGQVLPEKNTRTIEFAGVAWKVKAEGPWGPGPNYWSDSENSVWVDDQGRLHLTIRKVSGRWYCAEVSTTEYTSYGEHRFLVDGFIDRMDKNIVLGLFVYASDQAEIDVEYSKWGDPNKKDVGSFTVQPYTTPGNQHTFESPLDSSKTTHFFDWQPGYVLFGSIYGHYYGAPPSQNHYIEQWVYSGSDNPSESDNLHTHINFWLMNGEPPQDLSILEVVITDVVQPLNTSTVNGGNNGSVLDFDLKQNYPNPFNPSTVIRYTVGGSASTVVHVRLSVYNAFGQLVGVLVNKPQRNGSYSVSFDGNGLSSGVYYCRLQAGAFVQTRKMLLIR